MDLKKPRSVDYESKEQLASDWEESIRHGALATTLSPLPPIGSEVHLLLRLPDGVTSPEICGRVVQHFGDQVGLQLDSLNEDARVFFEGLVDTSEPPAEHPESPPAEDCDKEPQQPTPQVDRSQEALPRARQPVAQGPRPAVPQGARQDVALTPQTSQGPPEPSQLTKGGAAPLQSPSDQLAAIESLPGPGNLQSEGALPAATAAGKLDDSSLLSSLLDLNGEQATGVLVLRGFRGTRWGYLCNGRIVHFISERTRREESLGQTLKAAGLLTEDQWLDGLRAEKITGLAAGECLVRSQVITRDQLHHAYRKRAEKITQTVARANFGEWSFHPLPILLKLFPWPGIETLPLLFDLEQSTANAMTEQQLNKEFKDLLKHHVSVIPGREELVLSLPLNERHRETAVELLGAGWTPKELMVYGQLSEREVLRFLFLLRSLQLVRLRASEGEESKRNRAERALYVTYRDIVRRPDFEGLHCHWTAITEEIHAGYEAVLKEIDPGRFKGVLDDKMQSLIKQIRQRATELQEKLKTRQGRDSVRQEFVSLNQRILATDLMAKQGEMATYKAQWSLARLCFLRVVELAPPGGTCREQKELAKKHLANPQITSATGTINDGVLNDLGKSIDEAMSHL